MKGAQFLALLLFMTASTLAIAQGAVTNHPGIDDSATNAASASGFQSGYDAGVRAGISTCQVDPLGCNIFDAVRYWEAYYWGVDVAIDVCRGDPGSCGIEGAPWYNQGYSAGTASMMASCAKDPLACGVDISPWYNQGVASGTAQGSADCLADPIGCGVQIADVIPDPAFGETEPNDNMVAADPLVLEAPFWGQSYGNDDTDFFYLETAEENQTLVLNFQVPGTDPTGWVLRVRDAAGNVFATVDTASASTTIGADNDITYKATLGLAGSYYVEVECNTVPVTSNPYTLTVVLQDSPLDTGNFIIGFHDAEVEFNDEPSDANPLATGVTMYGLVNLTFDVAVPQDDEYVWAQGEPDWFRYTTAGNEIITLGFCSKEQCGPGNWLVEVYNAAGAAQLEAGISEQLVDPILAYNTDILDGSPQQPEAIRFGLMQAGTYYMRVNHKRLYSAPCAGFETDWDNDGLPSGPPGAEDLPQACGCASGYRCSFAVLNPTQILVPVETQWPYCPDGFNVGPTCQTDCTCTTPGNCETTGNIPGQACSCGPALSCNAIVPNPGTPFVVTETQYGLCPDGSGGGTSPRCTIGCICTAFGGLVEVPEGAVTGQYNFTWYGTKLPPFTTDSDAYDDFGNRPSPY